MKREQLAHELWHYKYDVDPSVRTRLTMRLSAVLWRFLGQHEKHIAEAVAEAEFEIVTTVPGTREREGEHPLERIVGTIVGQTKDRYQPLYRCTAGKGGYRRASKTLPAGFAHRICRGAASDSTSKRSTATRQRSCAPRVTALGAANT